MTEDYMNKEVRHRRRKPLCEGKCKCGEPATLPWLGEIYCSKCWVAIPKGGTNVQETQARQPQKEKK